VLVLSALALEPLGLLVAYSAAVVLASVVGGMIPQWLRLTHTGMQLLISLVGGVMLGIAIFHMIPHSAVQLGPAAMDQLAWGVMLGLLSTFFLLRFFHFHQHGPADFGTDETLAETHLCSDHTHATHLAHEPQAATPSARWLGVLMGLGLHTLLDGMALSASIKAEALHDHGMWLAGFGTFLAVFLHKPLDAISITSLMQHASPGRRLLVNLGFALMCPLGAFLFWSGADLTGSVASVAGWALAFSAGVFLCISLSDLLPEMEFHSHNRVRLTLALLLGIAIAWGIGLLEGAGAHVHHESNGSDAAALDHAGHDHAGHDHSGQDHPPLK